MKKNISIALLIVMMALAFVGCGAPTNGSGTMVSNGSNSGSEVSKARDILNVGVYAEPSTVDPALSKDRVTWIIGYQMYDTLVKYDQEKKEYTPGLATGWEMNPEGTEITFEIRQNVKFHNGDTMTMEDVLWSMTRELESSYTASLTGSMDRWEQVDETHIKLVLKQAYAPIYDVLVTPCFSVISKRAFEEAQAAGQDFGRIGCGTGAYKLVEWNSGDTMVFESHADYYEGAPAIKQVILKQIPDAGAGSIALEEGSIDYYLFLQQSDFAHLEEVPTLKKVENPGGVGIDDITFNVTDGIFVDKRLRQAVAYAINREEMMLGGVEGYGKVSNTPCATSSFGFIEDYPWYEQDVEKAKALLAEAGYPDGFDVVFSQEGSPDYMKPAEIMQEQLRQVGINVTFEKMERAAWLETVATNRDYVASLRMTTMVVNDVDYLLTRRLTSENLGGGNNYSGYQNPEFDALVAEARTLTDSEARMEIYRKCYDILKEDVPFIPLYTEQNPIYINAKLMGFINHPQNRTPWSKLYFEE